MLHLPFDTDQAYCPGVRLVVVVVTVGAGVLGVGGAGAEPDVMAAAHLPLLPKRFASLFGVFIIVSDSQLAM
jgi:hypothetical protein